MQRYESFNRLLTTLDNLSGRFVIKDFIGFLNWEPSLSTHLLRYTGHHSPYCQTIKQYPKLYACCAICSKAHQRRCQRERLPFTGTCFLGISEYSVPIIIDQLCIGSISIGNCCTNRSDALSRLSHYTTNFSIDMQPLKQRFEQSVTSNFPNSETQAVYQFIADFIAEQYRPYIKPTKKQAKRHSDTGTGFEIIQTYIFNNYTSPSISTTSIAQACGYSKSYISHTFHRRMHTNIRTYINQLRIILAKHELASGRSVTSTAMICGFNDPNYFSNIFRDMVGVSPSQYGRHAHFKDGELVEEAPLIH